jgi:hypothetical protein
VSARRRRGSASKPTWNALSHADQQAEHELEALALEAIDSGDTIDVGSSLIGKGDIAASLLPKGEGFQD